MSEQLNEQLNEQSNDRPAPLAAPAAAPADPPAAPPSRPAKRAGTKRVRTPAADVEGAVLAAAARLLVREGPDALSIRRIATEAGVAPMSLYNRFASKAGIVDELFRSGFNRLGTAFRSLDTGDPLENLRLGAHRYRELALRDPGTYSVMFEHAVVDYEPTPTAVAHAVDAFAALVELTERAQAAGHFGDHLAVEVAQILWECCHGAVSLELRDLGFVTDRDASYGLLLEVLLRGFAAGSTTTPP
jgi:AcrR family transcriptional regulator